MSSAANRSTNGSRPAVKQEDGQQVNSVHVHMTMISAALSTNPCWPHLAAADQCKEAAISMLSATNAWWLQVTRLHAQYVALGAASLHMLSWSWHIRLTGLYFCKEHLELNLLGTPVDGLMMGWHREKLA